VGADGLDDLRLRERSKLPGVAAGHEQLDAAADKVLQVSLQTGVVDVPKPVARERRHGHHRDIGEDPGPRRPVRANLAGLGA
jgi:hypothetical protein